MTSDLHSLYSQLPTIGRLLRDSAFSTLREPHGHTRVVSLLRHMLGEIEEATRSTYILLAWCEGWTQKASTRLERESQSALRPVINLAGTVLRTNLGRAPQVEEAVEAVVQTIRTPVTLEYSLDDTGRGYRDQVLADLLYRLTGAGDACTVNNNAAAVLPMLAVTTNGREVAVSRGELMKIGGAFRIPDATCQAGCIPREMGTTNRTRVKDCRQVVNENTALPMRVHTSSYGTEGFAKSVNEAELVIIGQELDVSVMADLDSGSLIDLSQYGLPQEPMPQRLIAVGVSLVSFSGDKLLGGSQARIIVSKKGVIARLQSHPLKRALRVDKVTLVALKATLRFYLYPEALVAKLPTLCQSTRSQEAIRVQAQQLWTQLTEHYGDEFALNMMPCLSQIGSGSLPANRLPSAILTFTPHDGHGNRPEALAARRRTLPMPIIGRIYDGRLWLDLRCPEDETRSMEMVLK